MKNKDRPATGKRFCEPSKEEKEEFNKIFRKEMAGTIENNESGKEKERPGNK